jgi:sugar phosphate isomerase/epimerase
MLHLPRAENTEGLGCAVSALKELAAYGASKNLVIDIENGNPNSERPERIVQVLKEINSAFLPALPDFCNSMAIHDDQTYNNHAMRILFPLAFNISHVKDSDKNEKTTYRVDVDEIFAIAKGAGYKGYVSMEWEGTGDAYDETQKLIAASLRNLG